VHYHYVSREQFEAEIVEGKFLEHAHVHGNIYGTSWAAIQAVSDAGKVCVLDIDVQGARSVRKAGARAIFVFVAPPSLEELERRLVGVVAGCCLAAAVL
jgi:guanylate kinase